MIGLRTRLVPLALVLSGFGALGVEVLWQRLLSRVLGGSTNAVTAVLIAYMGGLALGAALAGRRGDRLTPRAALRGYVVLEVVIWLGASAVTVVLASVPLGLGGLLTALADGAPRFVARFAIASLLLLLPTTAMGATLPLAVRAMAGRRREALLSTTAVLYAANTLGAVLGALATPFLLLPALGARGAALAAALGSLLAAAVASFSATAQEEEPAGARDAEPEAEGPAAPILLISAAAFSTGAASLGLQILWTRWLATLGGSSVYAFGLVVAVVLSGIVAGSTAVAALARRLGPKEAPVACGLLAVIGATVALLLVPLVEVVPGEFARLGAAGRLSLSSALLLLLAIAVAMILPPTICFGAVLPLAVRAARAAGRASAASVGRVYAANTVGALAGAAATGLGLVASLGLARSAVVLAVLPVVAGTALLLVLPQAGRARRALFLLLGIGAAFSIARGYSPSPYAGAARFFLPREGQAMGRVLYYGEGAEASVLVEAGRQRRTFYVNSRAEASTEWVDVRNQYLLAHLPALLAKGAPRSLVIGLGSGMTAGALTRWGEVTIAELNHKVPEAARQFADYNHDVVERARVRIEDGRVVLAEPGAAYSLVTTDPIHPGVAGSSSLYTLELFTLARRRLAPGGVISLWLPLYQMGPEELRAIVGSFVDVFPDAEAYLNHTQVILIGGGRPRDAAGSLALLRAGWSRAVADDLRRGLLESPEALAVSRVGGPAELGRYAGGARRNRDDDPWIELSLPRYMYDAPLAANIESFLALRTPEDAARPLARAFDALQRSDIATSEGRNQAAVQLLRATLVDGRSPLVEHAVRLRESTSLLALDLLRGGRWAEAVTMAVAESQAEDATVLSLLNCRDVLLQAAQRSGADAVTARLVRQWPERPEGHIAQGEDLLEKGRYAEAVAPLERAAAMDAHPGHQPFAMALLGGALLRSGEVERGRAALRRSLALNPRQASVRALLEGSKKAPREAR